MVADAESDIYALFAARPAAVHVVTRSARDRRLHGGGKLGDAVASWPAAGRIVRTIPAAPGRKERTVTLVLRFGRVEIAAPQEAPAGVPRALMLHALEVCEEDAPAGVTPVRWLLLTSHALSDATRAAAIVDMYRSRFLIEQLFRTLKSAGFRIEEVDIGEPKALIAFTGVALIAAVTLMQLVKAREGGSGRGPQDCFEPEDLPMLEALSKRLEGTTQRQKNPHSPADLAFASWIIARLGGWTGYYGKPGPAVMRYGLDRFQAIKLGTQLAQDV